MVQFAPVAELWVQECRSVIMSEPEVGAPPEPEPGQGSTLTRILISSCAVQCCEPCRPGNITTANQRNSVANKRAQYLIVKVIKAVPT